MLVRKIWLTYIINIEVHFVGYLHIMDMKRLLGRVPYILSMRCSCKICAIKHEGKRLLGRPRWWKGSIKRYVKVTGWKGVDWINWAHSQGQWRVLVRMVASHLGVLLFDSWWGCMREVISHYCIIISDDTLTLQDVLTCIESGNIVIALCQSHFCRS